MVTLALARRLAGAGKRVLILDLDTHRATLSREAGLDCAAGALQSSDPRDFTDMAFHAYATDVPGLSIMPAGYQPAGVKGPPLLSPAHTSTLDTTTTFMGHILALTSITLNDGASIVNGSALARNGAVVLNNNSISGFCADMSEPGSSGPQGSGPGDTTAFLSAFAPVPEPSTPALTLMTGVLLVVFGTAKRVRQRRLDANHSEQ